MYRNINIPPDTTKVEPFISLGLGLVGLGLNFFGGRADRRRQEAQREAQQEALRRQREHEYRMRHTSQYQYGRIPPILPIILIIGLIIYLITLKK